MSDGIGRVTGYALRVAGCEVRGAGYALRGTGCALRGTRYVVSISGYGDMGIGHGALSRTI